MIQAQVHFGFLQYKTSSTRSCTQNTGPTWSLSTIQTPSLTFVTNRRKLLDIKGKLNASLWLLSSLGRPGPPYFPFVCGSFGKFAGNNEPRRRSETFEDKEDVDGTANFRSKGGGADEGGKGGMDVRAGLVRSRSGEPEVFGDAMAMAEGGMWMYEGMVDMLYGVHIH